jgi:predicted hydrolase (HD superfamily)
MSIEIISVRIHINTLGEEFEKIVGEIDLSDQLIADIRSHYTEKTGVPVDLLIRKYLASVDELSGLMYAYSLMRPEWFVGMEAKSVMKKIKDKNLLQELIENMSEIVKNIWTSLWKSLSHKLIEALAS